VRRPRGRGPRARRLASYLQRRLRTSAAARPGLDAARSRALFHRGAVVFTDTADFTIRTLRDGILDFLMLFERARAGAAKAVRAAGGEIVKVEADSLLLRFPDVPSACRGVAALERSLRSLNRRLPEDEQLRFSYGIGYGDLLDLEGDLFGLEVNLASKIGEDMARPGQALLTPSAADAVPARARHRVVPHGTIRFGPRSIDVHELKLALTSRGGRT
jgi:adenylate cyclase